METDCFDKMVDLTSLFSVFTYKATKIAAIGETSVVALIFLFYLL